MTTTTKKPQAVLLCHACDASMTEEYCFVNPPIMESDKYLQRWILSKVVEGGCFL